MPQKKPLKKDRIIKPVTRRGPDPLQELADAAMKILGTEMVHRGSESDVGEPLGWTKSGVPGLDPLLDRHKPPRGWPWGRIVECFGGPQSCKTALLYALIAQTQKLGGVGVLFAPEGNVDYWLMKKYGVDLERLIIPDTSTVEGIMETINSQLDLAKRVPVVWGIDSIANMSTEEELADPDMGRSRAGQLRANLLSAAFRKLGPKVPKTKGIVFCINQIRTVPGATGSQKKTKPTGGWALNFLASIRIEVTMVGKLWRTRSKVKYVAGFKLKLMSEKNRNAAPFKVVTIQLDFDQGLQKLGTKPTRKKAAVKK
jgi:RecA/RadA recombinase